MKLVIFQGNPGLIYARTRHNLAWMVADALAKGAGAKWKKDKKHGAEVARLGQVVFAKPQKFYNLSGEVTQRLMKFYQLSPSDLLVVTDDLNLEFGAVRYRENGSAGGNNGLKSVIAHLGTEDFARVRLGTKNELREKMDDVKFVLGKFSRLERGEIPKIAAQVEARLASLGFLS